MTSPFGHVAPILAETVPSNDNALSNEPGDMAQITAFQGAFDANPDSALQYYGSSEMVRDLSDIREMAEEMRIHRNKTRPSFVPRVRNKPDLAEDIR